MATDSSILAWRIPWTQVLKPPVPGNKLTLKDNADSGVQFITLLHRQAQGRVSS